MNTKGEEGGSTITLRTIVGVIAGIFILLFLISVFLRACSILEEDSKKMEHNFLLLKNAVDDILQQGGEKNIPFYIAQNYQLVVFERGERNSGIFTRPKICMNKGCIVLCKGATCTTPQGSCLEKEFCAAYDLDFKTPKNYVVVEGENDVVLHLLLQNSTLEINTV